MCSEKSSGDLFTIARSAYNNNSLVSHLNAMLLFKKVFSLEVSIFFLFRCSFPEFHFSDASFCVCVCVGSFTPGFCKVVIATPKQRSELYDKNSYYVETSTLVFNQDNVSKNIHHWPWWNTSPHKTKSYVERYWWKSIHRSFRTSDILLVVMVIKA